MMFGKLVGLNQIYLFNPFFKKWGLTQEELFIIMSDQLDAKSFKQWEKRMEGRKHNINYLYEDQ